ncbi:MAG: hypothetical protein PSV40_00635 [Polaromonas sp.]|uniref:hypothetical protein n=1 Tax=Polaromonas sp. TaxID=1869339 RepID=UPI0024891C86|nr:hypothetical protein [Polaromonas sp.]MDI1267597.1 hypothetical protein [Polaromonas sp.]
MSSHPDTNHQSAWLSGTPPRRVLRSLVAYVSAVSVGIAAVAALVTAEVPLDAWIAPF